MKNNLQAALLVIALLSFLLGLSIGQNHQQHLQLQRLQNAPLQRLPTFIFPNDCRIAACGEDYNALRTAREELLAERDRLLNELHREIDRLRATNSRN